MLYIGIINICLTNDIIYIILCNRKSLVGSLKKPVIRSGAAASRQIGARPARDQEQATRSQDIVIL